MTDKDTGYDPESFEYLTFHDSVPKFMDGSDTPRAFLERCLETIEAREPVVKAWASMRVEGARADADASTKRYKEGRQISSVDGMPIGVKDLISTKDLPTNLGILDYESHTRHDSACMHAMRAAGGVFLGKTTTTELGMSDPSPTTNPFDRTRTPGGSSSGSGAVIAAKMVPAAIGSQVMGSLLRPASLNANFALRPSVGGLHRGERTTYSHAVIGVHAGSLADMWHLTIEIAKRSGGDPGYPGVYGEDHLSPAIRPDALAFIETQGWAVAEDKAIEAFEKLVAQLRAAGVRIISKRDNALVARLEESLSMARQISMDIISWENMFYLENLWDTMRDKLRGGVWLQRDHGRSMSVSDYRNALLLRDQARARLQALAPYVGGLITLNSTGPAPHLVLPAQPRNGIAYGTTANPAFNIPSSILGTPAVNLPLMSVEEMPIGMQVMGQQNQDNHITGVARWIYENVKPVSV